MNYINTPLEFKNSESSITIERERGDKIRMLDNLIELIVFTPKGSFSADPDFGFEYWNHEYSNIRYRNFNNNYAGADTYGLHNDVTRRECQDSIKSSLETYEPELKHVNVSIELSLAETIKQHGRRKVFSKYEVLVVVTGELDDGLGVIKRYEKKVMFFMEPTVKRITI